MLGNLDLLGFSIKELLSEDTDEGLGFGNLLSSSNVFWIQGRCLSNLDEFVFSSLDVLSYELNVSNSNSVVFLNALVSFPEFMLVNNGLFPVFDSKFNSKIISLTLIERNLLLGFRLLYDLLVLSSGGISNCSLSFLCKLKNILGGGSLGKICSSDSFFGSFLCFISGELGSLGISGFLSLLGLDLALVFLGELIWCTSAFFIRRILVFSWFNFTVLCISSRWSFINLSIDISLNSSESSVIFIGLFVGFFLSFLIDHSHFILMIKFVLLSINFNQGSNKIKILSNEGSSRNI